MDLGGLAPIRKLDIGILRQALNNDNLSTDEAGSKSQTEELLPEIFRLLASLEDDSQKMLLDSWAKMEMPLNEKTVSQLLQYFGENPALNSEDKMAVIKAFAFLESNGIPFSEKMVDALRSIFNQSGNLAASLEDLLNNDNFLKQNQLNNLLADLDLNQLKASINELSQLEFREQNIGQEIVLAEEGLEQNSAAENTPADRLQAAELSPGSLKSDNQLLNIELLNNFSNLDQEFKNMILNNLESLARNFDQNTVKILNNYLAGAEINSSAEKAALLKSFAFLENNQLPLSEALINEMKNNFQQLELNNSIAEINTKSELLQNLQETNSELVNKNEAVLNLNSKPTELAAKLADFSKISDQLISLFNKTGGEKKEEIADNFLGQKLVNLQQQEQNSPLMLALELPVELPNKKLSSLLLKVEAENQGEGENKEAKEGYNITFILEFENIGAVQSKININKQQLNTVFFTENAVTAELIKNHFPSLKKALNSKGFSLNKVRIKNFENLEEEKNQFFNKVVLSELNEREQEGKYRHIDIKI